MIYSNAKECILQVKGAMEQAKLEIKELRK